MSIPDTVRVKLSSEEAGAISVTPVVVEEITAAELFERIVSVAGKDAERIRRILRGGTLLEGATRFRWNALDADAGEIETRLACFPDPDPSRLFLPSDCVTVVLVDSIGRFVRVPREIGARRRRFRRETFWDVLMRTAGEGQLRYVTYSYSDQADCYRMEMTAPIRSSVHQAASLLTRNDQARQVRAADLAAIDFLVRCRP